MAEEDNSSMPIAEPFKFVNIDEDEEIEQEEQQQERKDPRPIGSGDPLQEQDPWDNYDSRPGRPDRQFAGAVTHPGRGEQDANPRRAIHDMPPEWDGMEPQKNLEPYLKLLQGWLYTTGTLPAQRGLIIMHHAKGDLRRYLIILR